MYTWDEPVILDSTDIYYFSEGEGAGHEMPESVKIEYQTETGEWVVVEAVPGCERDKYNTTELGKIRTTSLRLTLTPQPMGEQEVHGVGIIEWKVIGIYASDEEKVKEEPSIVISTSEDVKQVNAGESLQLSAEVLNYEGNKEITWSVAGNTANGTVIDEKGYLTVDKQEKAETITVKAALKEDPSCSSSG